MWTRKKARFCVEVELDAVPGVFNTPESAQEIIQALLMQRIAHYNPVVTAKK